jgi:hypothetical protein
LTCLYLSCLLENTFTEMCFCKEIKICLMWYKMLLIRKILQCNNFSEQIIINGLKARWQLCVLLAVPLRNDVFVLRMILTIFIISLNSINQLVIVKKIWVFSAR